MHCLISSWYPRVLYVVVAVSLQPRPRPKYAFPASPSHRRTDGFLLPRGTYRVFAINGNDNTAWASLSDSRIGADTIIVVGKKERKKMIVQCALSLLDGSRTTMRVVVGTFLDFTVPPRRPRKLQFAELPLSNNEIRLRIVLPSVKADAKP